MVAVGSQVSALGFVDHLGTLGNLVGSVVTVGSLVAVVAVAFGSTAGSVVSAVGSVVAVGSSRRFAVGVATDAELVTVCWAIVGVAL